MGNLLNGLANNGILNSSVTTTGMKDLSDSVNNTISQQQQSYMNLLNCIILFLKMNVILKVGLEN